MSQGVHIETCGHCGGAREGAAWRHRVIAGKLAWLPLCGACDKALPLAPRAKPYKLRARCQLRCGPGGNVGPRCKLFADHVQERQPCRPVGTSVTAARLLALRHPFIARQAATEDGGLAGIHGVPA